MNRTAGQVPDLPKEIKDRWMVENGYPCGSFKKCEKCSPAVYSTCSTWEIWFRNAWGCIFEEATILKGGKYEI